MKNHNWYSHQFGWGTFAIILFLMFLLEPQAGAVRVTKSRKSLAHAPRAVKAAKPPQGIAAGGEFFHPSLSLSGIGVDRRNMSDVVLDARRNNLLLASTFTILRFHDHKDVDAMVWMQRITSPELQKDFTAAAQATGFSKELLEADDFIESGGKANAKSPTGPSGIAQVTRATGERMGLVHSEWRTTTVTKTVPARKATKRHPAIPAHTVVTHPRVKVLVEDDRLEPSKAIMAQAKFLQQIASRYEHDNKLPADVAQELALWAYHSGEGVPNKALVIAKSYGIKNPTMIKLLLLNSPEYNPKLFDLIQKDLAKDFGPLYPFRVVRARQLIAMYRTKPKEFAALVDYYKGTFPNEIKTDSRFECWFRNSVSYHTTQQLKQAVADGALVHPPNNPAYFSYALRTEGSASIGEMDAENKSLYATDPKQTVGTLLYVAYEVRRGWEASHPRGEKFVPLEVTSMIRSNTYQNLLHRSNVNSRTEFPTHTIGAVDVSFARMPKGELRWLKFVMQDIAEDEYAGYFYEHEAQETMHFAPSPSHNDFFIQIYAQALDAAKKHR